MYDCHDLIPCPMYKHKYIHSLNLIDTVGNRDLNCMDSASILEYYIFYLGVK